MRLHALKDNQARAADPLAHAWVSASAGTGKTQVLSARVLRLLLSGTPPERILCLTFTKLAAAEMQTRIFDTLAHWVRCDDAELADDLAALRADADPDTARGLFGAVLDAPGGLQVQTLHAFAQSLIASFPLEADVAPGFATLDDRSALTLRRRLLTEAIEAASAAGDDGFMADLAEISIAGGEQRLGQVVAALVSHDGLLAGMRVEGAEAAVHRAMDLPADLSPAAALAAGLGRLDHAEIRAIADALAGDGGASFAARAAALHDWLGGDTDAQVAGFETGLLRPFTTAKLQPLAKILPASASKRDAGWPPRAAALADQLCALHAEQQRYAAAAFAARHLRIGIRLAADWRRAKARLGVVDYDDMIEAAVRLLGSNRAAEWVRYKLDSRIDHLLVDEAQDTNPKQWRIVEKLVEEFFAGEGRRPVDAHRTLFVVGDYKQSIFAFQGARPDVYRDQQDVFRQWAEDVSQDWRTVDLDVNFRSVAAILTVVDQVIEEASPAALGLNHAVPRHVAQREGRGSVTLWPAIGPAAGEEDDDGDTDADSASDRISDRQRRMAHRTAAAIRDWLDPAAPLMLEAKGRPCQPEDILVLVRSRSAFSAALVAALHDYGVPVAGVDRLKLTAPLAVQDLLALVRFALQPDDDLNLAALLVSPLVGLTQDALFGLAHKRPATLWSRVRDMASTTAQAEPVEADSSAEPGFDRLSLSGFTAARSTLNAVLALADFAPPYEFFETILSRPDFSGRSKLLARLGEEARDAIDAVLAQALAFETANAPSLQGFLAWVEADEIDLKRDPDAPTDSVRLMTVHAAKGLQAPVVILADAAARPRSRSDAAVMLPIDGGEALPLFLPSKVGLMGALQRQIDDDEANAEREHWRLLYVALTRAEDMLFIGGACTGANGPAEGSWYTEVERALVTLGADEVDAPGWDGNSLVYERGDAVPRLPVAPDPGSIGVTGGMPDWATTAAPQESRPPRPLSPSQLAADDLAAPPGGPAAKAAARRGSALHLLFERLPDLPPHTRRGAALAWAAASAPELDAAALADTALAIIDDPRFAAVFSPDALAEAPLAALVGDTVVAGKVDRLLVTATEVTVVDFKTGRRVPASAEAVEPYNLRQMAAYAAALARVFPGRTIRAALLYTEGPALIELPTELLAAHMPLIPPLIAGAAPLISPS